MREWGGGCQYKFYKFLHLYKTILHCEYKFYIPCPGYGAWVLSILVGGPGKALSKDDTLSETESVSAILHGGGGLDGGIKSPGGQMAAGVCNDKLKVRSGRRGPRRRFSGCQPSFHSRGRPCSCVFRRSRSGCGRTSKDSSFRRGCCR